MSPSATATTAASNTHILTHKKHTPKHKHKQIFATVVLLCKNRGQRDLRWVALRVALEFAQLFCVVFNSALP